MSMKNTEYWEIFQKIWKIMVDFAREPDLNNETTWRSILFEVNEITLQYRQTEYHPFVSALASAVINELDRLSHSCDTH